MNGIDLIAVEPVKQAVIDHGLCTATALFGWLKNQMHRAHEIVSCITDEPGARKQHGRVAVVAAGMHLSRVLARMLENILLGHGKGVHVRAKANGAAGTGRALAPTTHHAHHTSAPDAHMHLIHRHFPQGVGHDLGRAVLLKLEFGVCVDVSSDAHETIEEGVGLRLAPHGPIIYQPAGRTETMSPHSRMRRDEVLLRRPRQPARPARGPGPCPEWRPHSGPE